MRRLVCRSLRTTYKHTLPVPCKACLAMGKRQRQAAAVVVAAAAEVQEDDQRTGSGQQLTTDVSAAVQAAGGAVAAVVAEASKVLKRKKSKKAGLQPSVDVSDTSLRAKAVRIQQQLEQLYPDPPIPLSHSTTFQLLVAVVLSAQTTDAKVNEVTPSLFKLYPDPATMAQAEVSKVAHELRFLGLGPTKAKNVVALSKVLVEEHGGEVPEDWEALEALPGVGHKTASVVMSQAFGKDAFPVDTHIHRLAQRWGLTNGASVEQTETDLKALFPQHTWRHAHLQIIYLGREHCPAQRHDPQVCPVCSWAAVEPYNRPGASPAKPGQKPPPGVNILRAPSSPENGNSRKRGPTKAPVTAAATNDEKGEPAMAENVVKQTPSRKRAQPKAAAVAEADSEDEEAAVLESSKRRTPSRRRRTAAASDSSMQVGAEETAATESVVKHTPSRKRQKAGGGMGDDNAVQGGLAGQGQGQGQGDGSVQGTPTWEGQEDGSRTPALRRSVRRRILVGTALLDAIEATAEAHLGDDPGAAAAEGQAVDDPAAAAAAEGQLEDHPATAAAGDATVVPEAVATAKPRAGRRAQTGSARRKQVLEEEIKVAVNPLELQQLDVASAEQQPQTGGIELVVSEAPPGEAAAQPQQQFNASNAPGDLGTKAGQQQQQEVVVAAVGTQGTGEETHAQDDIHGLEQEPRVQASPGASIPVVTVTTEGNGGVSSTVTALEQQQAYISPAEGQVLSATVVTVVAAASDANEGQPDMPGQSSLTGTARHAAIHEDGIRADMVGSHAKEGAFDEAEPALAAGMQTSADLTSKAPRRISDLSVFAMKAGSRK